MDQKAKEMFEQYQSGMQGNPVMTSGGMNPASRHPLSAHGGEGAPSSGKPDYVYVPGKGLVKQ
jgi:hypothetical protein